jgi:hypothetical protein
MRACACGERRWRAVGLFGMLLLFPVLAGCGGGGQGTVSGKVIFKGKGPFKDKGLPGGRITFRPVDPKQSPVTVPIDPEGTYEAKVPVGEALIAVDNRELAPPPKMTAPPGLPKIKLPPGAKPDAPSTEPSPSAAQKLPGKYQPILDKYADADKSGLRITVKGGSQAEDFEVK